MSVDVAKSLDALALESRTPKPNTRAVHPENANRSYPLRATDKHVVAGKIGCHSLRCSDADRRRMLAAFKRGAATEATPRPGKQAGSRPDPRHAGLQFALFSEAWEGIHGKPLTLQHAKSAFGLLCRRVEGIPDRPDRVAVIGLFIAAYANTVGRVHLITESDQGTAYCIDMLQPVLERLGINMASIRVEDNEVERRQAYGEQVTVLSARETAMDFLRDAVNWPQRSNQISQQVDSLLGVRSRSHAMLMAGLPCAVHLDIDSTLLDNARTPIVLTRDAHPMHEQEELEKAFQMLEHLVQDQHYQWRESGSEVILTDLGRQQLQTWGEHLGGIWNTYATAELMLCGALTATNLLVPDRHYVIENQGVRWLVQERLVPGMSHYGKAFLTRLVEIKEECVTKAGRETIARASYQQVFNRYIHLCGTGHTVEFISPELRQIYGLISHYRWRRPKSHVTRRAKLCKDAEAKMAFIREWSRNHDTDSCRLLVTNSDDWLQQLQTEVSEVVPAVQVVTTVSDWQQGGHLRPGSMVIVSARIMDYVIGPHSEPAGCPIYVLLTQRSDRLAEDRRLRYWLQQPQFAGAEVGLILAEDESLFTTLNPRFLKFFMAVFGVKFGAILLEKKLRRIHSRKGRELFKLRRDLLSHDSGMQGLLSFSGKGLYE